MKLTYEYGLIVGTKREREYWKNKIEKKIEELNHKLIGASTGIYAVQVDVLKELLER